MYNLQSAISILQIVFLIMLHSYDIYSYDTISHKDIIGIVRYYARVWVWPVVSAAATVGIVVGMGAGVVAGGSGAPVFFPMNFYRNLFNGDFLIFNFTNFSPL